MLLSADAIFYNRFEKGVASRCSESIIPDFPIHPMLLIEEAVNAQMLKWEHATEFKQSFQTGCQEKVCVKIKAAEAIDRKISE